MQNTFPAMIMTEKHQRVLALAGTPTGMSTEIYPKEARELAAAGRIKSVETFTKAGGNRVSRWFLTAGANQ